MKVNSPTIVKLYIEMVDNIGHCGLVCGSAGEHTRESVLVLEQNNVGVKLWLNDDWLGWSCL